MLRAFLSGWLRTLNEGRAGLCSLICGAPWLRTRDELLAAFDAAV